MTTSQADVEKYLGPNPDAETALKEFQAALACVYTSLMLISLATHR